MADPTPLSFKTRGGGGGWGVSHTKTGPGRPPVRAAYAEPIRELSATAAAGRHKGHQSSVVTCRQFPCKRRRLPSNRRGTTKWRARPVCELCRRSGLGCLPLAQWPGRRSMPIFKGGHAPKHPPPPQPPCPSPLLCGNLPHAPAWGRGGAGAKRQVCVPTSLLNFRPLFIFCQRMNFLMWLRGGVGCGLAPNPPPPSSGGPSAVARSKSTCCTDQSATSRARHAHAHFCAWALGVARETHRFARPHKSRVTVVCRLSFVGTGPCLSRAVRRRTLGQGAGPLATLLQCSHTAHRTSAWT